MDRLCKPCVFVDFSPKIHIFIQSARRQTVVTTQMARMCTKFWAWGPGLFFTPLCAANPHQKRGRSPNSSEQHFSTSFWHPLGHMFSDPFLYRQNDVQKRCSLEFAPGLCFSCGLAAELSVKTRRGPHAQNLVHNRTSRSVISVFLQDLWTEKVHF